MALLEGGQSPSSGLEHERSLDWIPQSLGVCFRFTTSSSYVECFTLKMRFLEFKQSLKGTRAAQAAVSNIE